MIIMIIFVIIISKNNRNRTIKRLHQHNYTGAQGPNTEDLPTYFVTHRR